MGIAWVGTIMKEAKMIVMVKCLGVSKKFKFVRFWFSTNIMRHTISHVQFHIFTWRVKQIKHNSSIIYFQIHK